MKTWNDAPWSAGWLWFFAKIAGLVVLTLCAARPAAADGPGLGHTETDPKTKERVHDTFSSISSNFSKLKDASREWNEKREKLKTKRATAQDQLGKCRKKHPDDAEEKCRLYRSRAEAARDRFRQGLRAVAERYNELLTPIAESIERHAKRLVSTPQMYTAMLRNAAVGNNSMYAKTLFVTLRKVRSLKQRLDTALFKAQAGPIYEISANVASDVNELEKAMPRLEDAIDDFNIGDRGDGKKDPVQQFSYE